MDSIYRKICNLAYDLARSAEDLDSINSMLDCVVEYAKERSESMYSLGLKHGSTKKTTINESADGVKFVYYLSEFYQDKPAQFMNNRHEAESIAEWIKDKYFVFEKPKNLER